MRPIKYTNKNGETIFHYDKEALKGFVHLGRKHGDVGKILIGRSGDIFRYKGYGTYENPNKTLNSISVRHNIAFDGEMKSDEEIVFGNQCDSNSFESTGFTIIDFKKDKLGQGKKIAIETDFIVNQGNTECETIKQIIDESRK